ncbi:hypothetical protein Pla8534_17270 [Lignipirellula cremea]|uniref:Uncharacterized protein n=1 Tax=Lignipirellula cremea TaxID=2528010 RepID=A0A518DQ35_9BACT|nr:hypothetical protein Pla8534_17270 [Lignipirellula cremea]
MTISFAEWKAWKSSLCTIVPSTQRHPLDDINLTARVAACDITLSTGDVTVMSHR